MNPGYHKITIGGEPFCDYTDIVEWPAAGGGPRIMAFPCYGALTPVYVNLANMEVTWAPKVTITWPDNQHSWDFYMTCKGVFDGVADVLITHLDQNGVESTYKITAASVTVATENPAGPTTVSTLTIKGGVPVLQ